MDVARVKFYVRADGWAAWEALNLPADTLDTAYIEYKDERLVAAYLLEAVCADLRRQAREARQEAAAAQAAAGEQTKSYEVVGEWKEEYFPPGSSAEESQADLLDKEAAVYCSRAATLRRDAGTRPRCSVLVLPEQL